MTVAEYRSKMLAKRAAKAGISIAELIARGEAELAITHRVWDIRANRRSAWPEIARKAAAHGRSWVVVEVPGRCSAERITEAQLRDLLGVMPDRADQRRLHWAIEGDMVEREWAAGLVNARAAGWRAPGER